MSDSEVYQLALLTSGIFGFIAGFWVLWTALGAVWAWFGGVIGTGIGMAIGWYALK